MVIIWILKYPNRSVKLNKKQLFLSLFLSPVTNICALFKKIIGEAGYNYWYFSVKVFLKLLLTVIMKIREIGVYIRCKKVYSQALRLVSTAVLFYLIRSHIITAHMFFLPGIRCDRNASRIHTYWRTVAETTT